MKNEEGENWFLLKKRRKANCTGVQCDKIINKYKGKMNIFMGGDKGFGGVM